MFRTLVCETAGEIDCQVRRSHLLCRKSVDPHWTWNPDV